ncbi:hypothetical protein VP01_1429g1 [Puccinia sorghi]|uniref:Uncharacterized protein n=1 Tax=Puccinia sorghi TaxID=27349 RepID=A0A0L6VKG5_9BASI|nr:hypothetical protein VP01_1429g1 [Puccinia sorghi]
MIFFYKRMRIKLDILKKNEENLVKEKSKKKEIIFKNFVRLRGISFSFVSSKDKGNLGGVWFLGLKRPVGSGFCAVLGLRSEANTGAVKSGWNSMGSGKRTLSYLLRQFFFPQHPQTKIKGSINPQLQAHLLTREDRLILASITLTFETKMTSKPKRYLSKHMSHSKLSFLQIKKHSPKLEIIQHIKFNLNDRKTLQNQRLSSIKSHCQKKTRVVLWQITRATWACSKNSRGQVSLFLLLRQSFGPYFDPFDAGDIHYTDEVPHYSKILIPNTRPVRLGGVNATDDSSIHNQDCNELSFFQTSAIYSMIRRLDITKKGEFKTNQIEQQGMLKGVNKQRSCKWLIVGKGPKKRTESDLFCENKQD